MASSCSRSSKCNNNNNNNTNNNNNNNNNSNNSSNSNIGGSGTVVKHGEVIYELGPCLGKGGFGVCYKATERREEVCNGKEQQQQQQQHQQQQQQHRSTSRVVAVKRIDLKAVQSAGKELYLRYEIGLHSRLQHANIVHLFSTFSYQNCVYFVLEYCAKKSLADLVIRATALELGTAAHYFAQLCTGVRHMHSVGILHRDLKLSNILVTEDNLVKITDFGLSSTITRSYLERHLACGTPNYLSPEVLLRQGHTVRSDVWACGVVLYTMFGGLPPFQAEELPDIYRNIITGCYAFSEHYHNDAALRDLVKQMLRLEPEERPSFEEILQHKFCCYANSSQAARNNGNDNNGGSPIMNGLGCATLRRSSKSVSSMFSKQEKQQQLHEQQQQQQQQQHHNHHYHRKRTTAIMSKSLTTVIDIRQIKIASLLDKLHEICTSYSFNNNNSNNNNSHNSSSSKRLISNYSQSWLTWWRDKSDTGIGLYYQLTPHYNCVLYSDNSCCVYHRQREDYRFFNINSRTLSSNAAAVAVSGSEINKFYEPLVKDLNEEFADVPAECRLSEQLTWICARGAGSAEGLATSQERINYVLKWSSHCSRTYYTFYMADGSVQVHFGDKYILRVCDQLCYFYQASAKGFLIETAHTDSWCLHELNAELVDVMCDIFLSSNFSHT